jgi:hypothetical protein
MLPRSLSAAALLSVVLAGCGGDDSEKTTSAAPQTQARTQAQTQAQTTPEADAGLPQAGAAKLTAAQKSGLLAKNNEIALGEYDPSANGPKTAANFRAYAKPLAAGPCKRALTASAETWEALAKADAAGDSAKLKQLGQKTLTNSTSVFNDC